ncbi:MAG: hypothetical protein KDM81_21355, partial [Verrucomicrobiae bacterium]|nr:hypothetical protein [Verrucomicrobiae bacterium]
DQLRFLPDGRLAVAVEEQLWLFDPATQRFASVVHPRQRRIGKVLRQTGAGQLCVETQRVGDEEEGYQLELFDGAGFLPWTNAPPPIDLGAELFFLAEASNGDLWLGGSAGPARWREGQWQVFSHADGYDDEGALCWLELPDGHIWCAGLSRVSAFDGKRWNTLREGLDRVNGLVRTTDGSVWVATGSGLHRHFNGEWVQVDPAEGLPGALAHCALEDHRRRLWAGTSRGLSLLHPRADIDPPITLAVESAPFPEPDSVNGLRVVFRGRDKWRFTEDDRLLFSHRLDEGEWSGFHPRAEAVLADLTAGPHRLEV